jgi:hypothetical protein
MQRRQKALEKGIPHEQFKTHVKAVLANFLDLAESAPDIDDALSRMLTWVIRDGLTVSSRFIDDEKAAYTSLSIEQHLILGRVHKWYKEYQQNEAKARKDREPLFEQALEKLFQAHE